MPTRKTRINLTVDDDMDALLSDISFLQSRGKATLVSHYLDVLRPNLLELRDSLRVLKQKESFDNVRL